MRTTLHIRFRSRKLVFPPKYKTRGFVLWGGGGYSKQTDAHKECTRGSWRKWILLPHPLAKLDKFKPPEKKTFLLNFLQNSKRHIQRIIKKFPNVEYGKYYHCFCTTMFAYPKNSSFRLMTIMFWRRMSKSLKPWPKTVRKWWSYCFFLFSATHVAPVSVYLEGGVIFVGGISRPQWGYIFYLVVCIWGFYVWGLMPFFMRPKRAKGPEFLPANRNQQKRTQNIFWTFSLRLPSYFPFSPQQHVLKEPAAPLAVDWRVVQEANIEGGGISPTGQNTVCQKTFQK